MNLTLVRHAYLPSATLGYLHCGSLTVATLEEPWIDNRLGPGGQPREPMRQESCVPDGKYDLQPHNTEKHPNVWALVNPTLGVWHYSVPAGLIYGRAAILIHSGNTTRDIAGCVLVGLRHGRLDNLDAVLDSRVALEQLRGRLGTQAHSILIRPSAGTTERTI